MTNKITKEEIYAALEEWCEALVQIGEAWSNADDYVQFAVDFIKNHYAYDVESKKVLFKPTMARILPFRDTAEGALSYFIGGSKEYPEDTGFALEPWSLIEFDNCDTLFQGDVALSMGRMSFTSKAGNLLESEFSFGYIKVDGNLKIILHHSSFVSMSGT